MTRRSLLPVLVALPSVAIAWLLTHPDANLDLSAPVEHVVIVTNVSVLALLVALLVARSALQLGQYRILLLALGFMTMAGIFAVHGLTTPGVLLKGRAETDAEIVVGVSAALSLLIPALFFAVRYTRFAEDLERRWRVHPLPLLIIVTAALVSYAVVGLARPDVVSALFSALSRYGVAVPSGGYGYGFGGREQQGIDALPAVLAAITVLLLLFAAWRQAGEFRRSRLPMHGGLVGSYLFLAQAQVSMLLSPVWAISWWEYHSLMLAAVVLALGALFLELDRRRGLERFLPATVVERVIKGEPLRLGGERHVATILFADLRGSTALAEKLPPEAVVAVLNDYLGALARQVFGQGGVLDKFLGDGLMSIFGVFQDGTDGALPATRAALEMRRAVARLSAERAARGEPTVRFGVGIHTGEVVLGAVGLPERSDYTALGDTVNTASRLEALCKEYDVDVVLSGAVASRLRDGEVGLQALGEATVRGKSETISVFTIAR